MLRVHVDLKKNNNLIFLFAGICFFLSSIELMIPKPIPFFRIGLANLPILIGIDIFSFPAFLLLLLIKVLGQAIISGTLFSYISFFSLLSTLSAGLAMYALKAKASPRKYISFIGISVIGAFVSNTVQLALAVFIIFGKSALYVIPVMYIIGTITSIILGIFANKFTEDSIWYQQIKDGSFSFEPKIDSKIRNINELENYLRIASGILLFLILFFINYLAIKALVLGVALILCVVDKQKINFLNLILMFLAIIFFNLFPPAGQIIFSVGKLAISSEALLRGLGKAIVLESMIYISKWMLKAKINFKSSIGISISKATGVFSKLMTVKKEIKLKNLISGLDAVLLSINKL